uniref:Uncharacterized protein n=1 Tax=Arundo donax TaxID=35708 RepID=A0A0A9FDK2_ARUDO
MKVFLAWVTVACRGLKEIRLIGYAAPVEKYGISAYFSCILYHNQITKIELRRPCQFTDRCLHYTSVIPGNSAGTHIG